VRILDGCALWVWFVVLVVIVAILICLRGVCLGLCIVMNLWRRGLRCLGLLLLCLWFVSFVVFDCVFVV